MRYRINRLWWEQITPKDMHRRLPELERAIAEFVSSPQGVDWIRVATTPHGVFRVRPGDSIPTLHFVALGDAPIFRGDFQVVRDGHRTVQPFNQLARGPLVGNELVLRPEIRLELVTDPVMIDATRRGARQWGPGITKPSTLVTIPASYLLSPQVWPRRAFVLYQHIFGNSSSYPDDGWFYVGVTTRSWQARWAEHRRAIESGSPLLFHRRWREEADAGRITYVHHKVMGITDDLETLYASEEFLVDGHWEDARRLNMIPGGKSGLRYLRENGLLPERVVPMPDERDRIVSEWLRKHPRTGLPAPWVSERWKDDAWAVAQICGRDDRLSADQVRAIRRLAETHSPAEISARIGARNPEQVKRVLDAKTYTRVT